jgi:S-adenosylmethionine:tRNA ribosyltransferase-isomerase
LTIFAEKFFMPDPFAIRIADYDYPLPADRIAQYPLAERDASKLLIFSGERISQDVFLNIGNYLPADSYLVFNDTKVIRARLLFNKTTGAQIEIFCLEPVAPVTEIQAAFRQQAGSAWKCLVGNLKRWKAGILVHEGILNGTSCRLFAEYMNDTGDGSHVIAFHWDPPEKSFSEILELSGLIPLPPYIHRKTEPSDATRYQTIYASREGSVAAPTAGLHFTGSVFQQLEKAGIASGKVTLHVGVGTFRPVSVETIRDHSMHHEKIVVSRQTIESLLNSLSRPVIAVGTTSARTLESLYWLGVRLLLYGHEPMPAVAQWDPYQGSPGKISTEQALEALLRYLDSQGLEEYSGETQLMIVPGYRFMVISGLVTNFHMPKSSLLLLVAAMIGERWKEVYEYALSHDFRFLSYGDSCLFLK